MKLVMIPAGEFWMGSTPEQIALVVEQARKRSIGPKGWTPGEGPRHRVHIAKPFYMGVYEVTQSEYHQVMYQEDPGTKTGAVSARMVSWEEAGQFCEKLSVLPKERSARRVYRLPTEAEHEYASRAGSTTLWWFGDDLAPLGDYAWFRDNANGTVHPVGQKKPNPWGLFDILGNAWEWCSDRYGKYNARGTVDINPSYNGRVMRGGSCMMGSLMCRSAFRDTPMNPTYRAQDVGFRVVCEIGGGIKAGRSRSGGSR